MISAFHSAQPRARAQVPSSWSTASRNAARPSPEKNVHATTRSHAGSPTPDVPKSITADSTPSRTSRLPSAMSPWNQTGDPVEVARERVVPDRRRPGRRRRGRRGVRPRRASRRRSARAGSRGRSCARPRAGPSSVSTDHSARRNAARSSANRTGSSIRSARAVSPGSHRRTDHRCGYSRSARRAPPARAPAAAGAARGPAASGPPSRPPARSRPPSAAAPSGRRRAGRSGCPSRRPSTGVTGRSAHCGCCAASSRRTSAASMPARPSVTCPLISSGGAGRNRFPQGLDRRRVGHVRRRRSRR